MYIYILPASPRSQVPLPVTKLRYTSICMMMKQSSHSCVPFIFVVLLSTYLSSLSSARLLASHQENQLLKLSETYGGEDDIEIMGAEVCDAGDGECLKRRVISEAHLDYIYTQHHKP